MVVSNVQTYTNLNSAVKTLLQQGNGILLSKTTKHNLQAIVAEFFMKVGETFPNRCVHFPSG